MSPTEHFVQTYRHQHPLPLGARAVGRWAFAHPKAVRALQTALASTGAAAYVAGMAGVPPRGWLVSSLGVITGSAGLAKSKLGLKAAGAMGCAVPIVLTTALGGPLCGLATGVGIAMGTVLLGGYLFEKVLATVGYDTATYPYVDRAYAGCRLYHVKDTRCGRPVPVLELNAQRPFSAGFAHGYLLGPQIRSLVDNFQHDLLSMPNYGKSYPATLALLRELLEEDEVLEIRGMVAGFNFWALEAHDTRRVTFDDVLGVQLLPDMCHFRWQHVEQALNGGHKATPASTQPPVVGCTSVMLRDADGKVVWGRNMDWGAFGKSGAMSLPMVWKNRVSGQDYAVLGIPGLMGAVTGWNASGLSLAMNVVGGHTLSVGGIPAALYNRRVLRDFASVAQVAEHLASPSARAPLGPYHVMVADAEQGRCFSFYQRPDKSHHVRTLYEAPLWCLNWSYPQRLWDAFASAGRQNDLEDYFGAARALGRVSGQDAATLVEGALQLGSTNQFFTLHTLIFHGDTVSMRWDNAFAAQRTPVEISRNCLFSSN